MATSSLMSTSNQYVKYYIECIQNSQSIANNTSSVTVKVWAKRTNSGYETYGTGTVYCKVNGTTYSAAISTSQKITSTPICLYSGGFTIPHNDEGTKTLTMSAWINIPSIVTSSEQSYSQSLTTIARTSQSTVSSYSTTMGNGVTIYTHRASTSFKHTITYKFGSASGTIVTGLETDYTWTIPLSLSNQIPNSTSGVGTLTCHTYNGSTLIGTKTVSFQAVVPNSIVPSFSSLGITRVDNGVPSAWGVYVRGKSKATLTINGASGSYGSSIVRYSISGGGYSSTASSFTTGVLNTIGTNTFTATITDSRGRTATKTVTCSVVDYFTPRISYVEAYRCTSAGVIDENGTYIKVKADFTYASVSGKNTFSSNVSYAVYDSISWSTPVAITNNAYSSAIGGGAISIDNSYTVKFRVADYFTSHEVYETIPTPTVTMDFKKGGKGIGIGKVSQTDNLLDVAWNTNVDGDLYVGKRSYLNGLVDISGFTSIYSGMNVSQDVNFYKNIYVTEWIRCLGTTGVFFQNYGGGFNMSDTTWIRTYGSKNFYCDKILQGQTVDAVALLKVPRICARSGENFFIGSSGNNRVEPTSTGIRIYTTPVGSNDSGLMIQPDGTCVVKANNVTRHAFQSNGTKTGGSMEIDGTVYGMSPTDSPQTLIEYIEYDVEIDGEQKIMLDSIYQKMISKYAVFPSNSDVRVVKKERDSFTVIGKGLCDFCVKGQRKDADEYFRIMGGFEHGNTEEGSI